MTSTAKGTVTITITGTIMWTGDEGMTNASSSSLHAPLKDGTVVGVMGCHQGGPFRATRTGPSSPG
jgi:hypothetical protein